MKKFLSIVLAVITAISLALPAFAAEETTKNVDNTFDNFEPAPGTKAPDNWYDPYCYEADGRINKYCLNKGDYLTGAAYYCPEYKKIFTITSMGRKVIKAHFEEIKNEDGTTADISSGNAGDAMIAFPRRGLSIKTVGTKIYVSMTDDPDNADFEYNAHTRGTTQKDVFYLGVYKGYTASSKLRSLKGKAITANQTIGTFRTQAQANGSGYEQSGFYQLTFRQVMFILKYKTLNSQSAVGMGYVLSSHNAAIASGGTETWGMDCEEIKKTNPSYMTDQNHHVKCFGLEDFWGNIWEWIDGLVSDSSRNVLTANSGFNDSGSGYTNNGNGGVSANIGNYMSKPQGSTKAGFVAKEVNGSETTYFCDYAYLYASCVARFGGRWANAAAAGAFQLYVNNAASISDAAIAARLMYL